MQADTTVLGRSVPATSDEVARTAGRTAADNTARGAAGSLSLRFKMLSGLAILLFLSLLASAFVTVLWLPLSGPSGDLMTVVVSLAFVYAAVLVFAGDYLLTRLVLRPVEQVVDGVEKIAAGDKGHRLSGRGSREMRGLATTVNAMASQLLLNQEKLARNVESLKTTNRALSQTRAELVQAEKLATVGILAAGIAHEIGNPLGAILGYLELARRANNADGWTDDIRVEVQRIDRIIKALHDYARPRSSTPRPVDVNRTVSDTVELLEVQGKLKGIDVRLARSERLAPVLADPTQLQQVLVNLLLNACDALARTPDARIEMETSEAVFDADVQDGPTRRESDPAGVDYSHLRRLRDLQAGRVHLRLVDGAPMARIVVADNGPGIPEAHLQRVFEPFFTTKEPGRGTGLGLAVSARLIEGMNGMIRADNRAQGGARFTIQLPISTEKNANSAEKNAK